MIRKRMMGLLVAAGVMAMTVNAMAAGSITGAIDQNNVTVDTAASPGTDTGDYLVRDKEVAVTGNAELTMVEDDTYEEELQALVDTLNDAPGETTVEDAFALYYTKEEMPQIDLYDYEGLKQEKMDMSIYKFLSPVMDLELELDEDDMPTEEDPVKITFTANNMTDNIEVFVLHLCEKHSWELLETTLESDNQVSAWFHSASPVALIYKEKPVEEEDTDVVAP